MRSRKNTRRVCFRVRAPSHHAVYVDGTFNGWNSRQNRLWQGRFSRGIHTTHLSLQPGRYEYKSVFGRDWLPDPDNPDTVYDGHGSMNRVFSVT